MNDSAPPPQDKRKEIAFFDRHAEADDYNVFTPAATQRLVDALVRLAALPPGSRVADLGCGSGTFTDLIARAGYRCVGLDISCKLLEVGRLKYPQLAFVDGEPQPPETMASGLAFPDGIGVWVPKK